MVFKTFNQRKSLLTGKVRRGGGEGYYHYLFFNKGERKGKKIYLAKKVYKKHISNTDR